MAQTQPLVRRLDSNHQSQDIDRSLDANFSTCCPKHCHSTQQHYKNYTFQCTIFEGTPIGPGVIPKNQLHNKWRLIVDLSHPRNQSFNDGIPKDLCTIKYIAIKDAIKDIITLGKGTMLAKVDIKSAF